LKITYINFCATRTRYL